MRELITFPPIRAACNEALEDKVLRGGRGLALGTHTVGRIAPVPVGVAQVSAAVLVLLRGLVQLVHHLVGEVCAMRAETFAHWSLGVSPRHKGGGLRLGPSCEGGAAFGVQRGAASATAAGAALGADLDVVSMAKRSRLRESVGAVSRHVEPDVPSARIL